MDKDHTEIIRHLGDKSLSSLDIYNMVRGRPEEGSGIELLAAITALRKADPVLINELEEEYSSIRGGMRKC